MKIETYLPILLLSFIPFCFSCKEDDSSKDAVTTEAYDVIRPIVMDTLIPQDYIAKVAATEKVDIRTRITGFVEKVYIDEGRYAQKGQILFMISNDLLKQKVLESKARLNSTQIELQVAELEYSNIKKLFDKNIVSDVELKGAQNRINAVQAKIEQEKVSIATDQINLRYSEIKAPFSGFVNLIPKKVGSLVNEGDLLTTLSKTDEVYTYFDVSEKDYLNLVTKKSEDLTFYDNVEFITATGEKHPHLGKIEVSIAEVDEGSGNISFRARFPNPERILKHGSTGRVRVKKQLNDVLIIPQSVTFEIQDRTYVYVLGKQDKLESRHIEIGQRLNNLFVIQEGLAPDDRVLFEGIQEVKAGMRIIPNEKKYNIQIALNQK